MRHSDLIDPADLHFSKFKTFSGSASLVTPDFANQLIAATDSNKVYRATGTTQGAVVELAPPTDGNGQNSGNNYAIVTTFFGSPSLVTPAFADQLFASLDTNKIYRATGTTQGALVELSPVASQSPAFSLIGSGYPTGVIPNNDGSLYFDSQNLMLYIFNQGVWLPIENNLNISVSISNSSSTSTSDIYLSLFYSQTTPFAPFDFTDLVDSFSLANPPSSVGAQFSNLIHSKGFGYYALGVQEPLGVSVIDLSLSNSDGNALSLSLYGSGLTALGNPIPSKAIELYGYPARLLNATLNISLG